MKTKCPVALCGEIVNPKKFYKHIKQYAEKYKGRVITGGFLVSESHERWAQSQFPQIWNLDIPVEAKWTRIARAHIQQLKDMQKQHKKSHIKPMGDSKIEFKDGIVTYNGKQYTPDEFAKIMPGIKMGR